MSTSTIESTRRRRKPRLRLIGPSDERDVSFPEIISRERLEEARIRIRRETFWAGRNSAMRLSARVAA